MNRPITNYYEYNEAKRKINQLYLELQTLYTNPQIIDGVIQNQRIPSCIAKIRLYRKKLLRYTLPRHSQYSLQHIRNRHRYQQLFRLLNI